MGFKVADPKAISAIDLSCVVNGAGTKVTITIDDLPEGAGFALGDSLSAPVLAAVKAHFGARILHTEGGPGPLPPPPEKAKMS